MLLYAPATRRDSFVNAIGYLIRRLDENTGPQNFLRHAFKLEVGSHEWLQLADGFAASFERIDSLPDAPRRTQDRAADVAEVNAARGVEDFVGDPHTDFSLEQNLAWAEAIIERWEPRHGDQAADIPLVIAGQRLYGDREVRECLDPSRPGVVVGRYRQATNEDIDRALACASEDASGWRALSTVDQGEILSRVAQRLREKRGELIGAALADGGKLITESDAEVAEAIDFVDYYAASARELRGRADITSCPKGVVVVVPPWNFPVAIPCGGISAGLAAGNTVILKPASHTVLVAYELCKCFWDAGVPMEALQFVPCSGRSGGARLVASQTADVVILTGGTDTALSMLDARPDMNLLAETGGKNATIITAMSDRELAIKHLLDSAFGHSGQKCSATSLLVLEREVYESQSFIDTLCDAIKSMKVGSAWELDTKMGPLVQPPSGDLVKGLKELELGESWALMSRNLGDNPCLYSAAVKWDVKRGNDSHMTEFFGPVLAVMPADSLDEAIEIVNQTGYGLTSGIESLDAREQSVWRESIRAGNLYINRGTTGAIVLRQPFGGMGKSAFGPGIKAGGPNYVAQLMDFEDAAIAGHSGDTPVARPELERLRQSIAAHVAEPKHPALPAADAKRLLAAIASYDAAYETEFGIEHDHFALVGQDNIRRYLAVEALRIRIHPDDTPFEIFARVCAAKAAGCRMTVSQPPQLASPAVALLDDLTASWAAGIEFVEESDAELAALIADQQSDRVRYAAPDRAPESVLRAVGDSGIYIARSPVLVCGRLELLWYLREQSISHDYHRYGNLGARSGEQRRAVD
jgi:RHH-type proline utilization regulon transcriptional repressor/proline dehydrogenase/delta 1-pyrroline-5-carboxylate dehydrogenase